MAQRLLALMLMLTLMLTACGGGATTTAPAATPADTPTDAPAVAPAADEEPTAEPTAEAAAEPTAEAEPTTAATTESADTTTTETDSTTEAETSDETASGSAADNVQRYVIVPEESQVSYTVDEVFFREGNRLATAVGVTQIISGEVLLDRDSPQNSSVGPITIDISAFTSDSDRRDNAIRERWLESARFPIATFVPTQIEGLPETYTDGEEITLQITGDLTIRETTSPVTFDVTGQITGDEMTGTATTDIKMSDFGFDPPDIAGILKAEDDARLTFDFVARPAA